MKKGITNVQDLERFLLEVSRKRIDPPIDEKSIAAVIEHIEDYIGLTADVDLTEMAFNIDVQPYSNDYKVYTFCFWCPICSAIHEGREIASRRPRTVGYVLNCTAPDMLQVMFPPEIDWYAKPKSDEPIVRTLPANWEKNFKTVNDLPDEEE